METNIALLNGLKQQLQKVLFNQQQLLGELEKNHLVPEYDVTKPLVLDSKSVPEMKSVLQGEYIKLEKFEVVLAVVGTMKAGKSTTINAIVGREILPNRNRPMTSLPTLIAHVKGQKEPILSCDVSSINEYIAKLKVLNLVQYAEDDRVSSYQEILELIQNIQAGYKFKEGYKGEEAIFSFLAHLNDLVRLSRIIVEDYPEYGFPFSAYKEINALPRIEVEFTELAQQEEHLGNLVLLDTPGPNEANLPELKEIFAQQLKRSSAVMVVMDYTQLKSQADADIREELEKLPKIEKDRLFALVNKFDQKNANGDDQATTKNIVANDLLKGKIHAENIYCISAQDAFLATRIQNYIELNQGKPSFDELEWVQDFAKKAFGEMAELVWETFDANKVLEFSRKVAEKSNIELPLINIIQESYKNAPKIAMQSALRDVDSIFTSVTNYFSVHGHFNKEYQMTEAELKKIKESLVKLENDKKQLKEYAAKSLTEVDNVVKKSQDEISKKFKDFEELSRPTLVTYIINAVDEFKANKQTAIEEKIGKSGFEKIVKLVKINDKYAEDKSTLKAELDSLNNAFRYDVIKLEADKMRDLSDYLDKKIKGLACEYESSLTGIFQDIFQEFNEVVEEVNTVVIANISKISQEFGQAGIEIQLVPLKFDFKSIQSTIQLNLSENSKESHTSRRVESTKIFAGLRRWFGDKTGNKDWGYEMKEIKYLEIKLGTIISEIEKNFLQSIANPMKFELEKSLVLFNNQTKTDLEAITLQIEELVNELQIAYDAEQLPYEQKKVRKDLMNDIETTNKSIQIETQTINKYLPEVLGDVV
ncbi:dynamin family protein [Acinetobacter sp. CFCC 10889]|uniref:dynamin family protein n=1 Tax=Acinetobacter sp. CFCC 10889 TaxID=1775557 RepID=UPI0013A6B9FC|nr:dynamin family protein [Acinetobacter sp. CFCC 10889]